MYIEQAEYVVFDVETTGLTPLGGDRMVEIAAMKVSDGRIGDKFHSLINPQRSLPIQAQAVNKITEEMIADAPIAEEVLPKMINFIGGACLVGHNVGFDLKFLCHELSLIGRKLQETTPAIDTLKMARKLLPQLVNHKLETVARFLGVPIEETHRALADVELTVGVMNRLLEVAKEQQIESFKQIFKAYGVEKPKFKIVQETQASLF